MRGCYHYMLLKNEYKTCYCGLITEKYIGKEVKVAGWIENVRDHGGVTFLDLRDHYGIVQIVINDFDMIRGIPKESTISVSGNVVARSQENINSRLKTGFVEIKADKIKVLGKVVNSMPFEVTSSTDTKEELRLKYRFLDLRNKI